MPHPDFVIAKDTDEEITLKQPAWARGSTVLVAAGIVSLPILFIREIENWTDPRWLVSLPGPTLLAAVAISGLVACFFLYLGLWVNRISFDRALGQITVQQSVGPIRLRSRQFSKRGVQRVEVEKLPGVDIEPDTWLVSVLLSEGRSVQIHKAYRQSNATYIAERLADFLEIGASVDAQKRP